MCGQTYIKYLKQDIDLGYKIELHFLWLPSADESNQRVKQRVLEGGHHVSEIDILRRYPRIMKLIFSDFLPQRIDGILGMLRKYHWNYLLIQITNQ